MTDDTIYHGTVEGSGNKFIAIFSYLGIFILIPLLSDFKKDLFVKFHLKQGLVLIIFDAIGWLLAIVIGWIPLIGWLVITLWTILGLVAAIVGILNVIQGKEKDIPVIGHYARKFTF